MLADHQRRSLHQDVARGLDLVGIVPEPGRARLLEGVSLEHHAKRQCVRRAPRGPGDRGGVLKRPRRDRRGHPRVSRGSIRLRELHANPLDATRPPARARDSARDRVAGSGRGRDQKKARNGSSARGKKPEKDGEANCTPSFPRCSRCERTMQVTMRRRPRCDPRRVSRLLARSHTIHAHSR